MFYIGTLLERGDRWCGIIYICGQLEALARHKQESGFSILLCTKMNKNPKTHFPECSLTPSCWGRTWTKGQLTPFLLCSRDLSTWTVAHLVAECFLHWAGKNGYNKLLQGVQLRAELTFLCLSSERIPRRNTHACWFACFTCLFSMWSNKQ